MKTDPAGSVDKHLANLKDPRENRTKLYKLIGILVIAICAVIYGADGQGEVELFGQAKETWFKTFRELPNGIPSRNTSWWVFAKLDPEQFQQGSLSWISSVSVSVLGGSIRAQAVARHSPASPRASPLLPVRRRAGFALVFFSFKSLPLLNGQSLLSLFP